MQHLQKTHEIVFDFMSRMRSHIKEASGGLAPVKDNGINSSAPFSGAALFVKNKLADVYANGTFNMR